MTPGQLLLTASPTGLVAPALREEPTDTEQPLAWDVEGRHHLHRSARLARRAVERGQIRVVSGADVTCDESGCPVRVTVVSPLVIDDVIVGTLQACAPRSAAGLARAANEVAGWVDVLLAQPAAWSVPLAFAVMVDGSRATADRVPAHAAQFLARLHAPEALEIGRG